MGDNAEKNFDLKPVWNAILDVYQAVAKILYDEKVQFWAAYGTVLGAVRHKGFIPWDDDFDICIPNTLFLDAVAKLKANLPSYYKVISCNNEPLFNETFIKVQDCRREVVENVEKASMTTRPHGIYIDIFPIDGIPDSWFYVFWARLVSIIVFAHERRISKTKSLKKLNNLIFSLIVVVTCPLCFIFRKNADIQNYKHRFALNWAFGTTKYCGRYLGLVKKDYPWRAKTSDFSETLSAEFQGITVPIPGGFDDYLTANYGNYMKEPPQDLRCRPYHETLKTAPWKFGPTAE